MLYPLSYEGRDGPKCGRKSRSHRSIGCVQRTGRLEPVRNANDGHAWSFIESDACRQRGAVMRSTAERDAIGLDHAN